MPEIRIGVRDNLKEYIEKISKEVGVLPAEYVRSLMIEDWKKNEKWLKKKK